MAKTPYLDMGGPQGLPENERIKVICDKVLSGGRIGVLVDNDKNEPGKADRYIKKIRLHLYGMPLTITKADGPVEGVVTLTIELNRSKVSGN